MEPRWRAPLCSLCTHAHAHSHLDIERIQQHTTSPVLFPVPSVHDATECAPCLDVNPDDSAYYVHSPRACFATRSRLSERCDSTYMRVTSLRLNLFYTSLLSATPKKQNHAQNITATDGPGQFRRTANTANTPTAMALMKTQSADRSPIITS